MAWGWRLPVAVCAWLCATGSAAVSPSVQPVGDDAQTTASWVLASGDHGGRPFAVVDKKSARMQVFDAAGRRVGESPVLIGQTAGDAAGTKMGSRTIASLAPAERTTPAGRVASEPGVNDTGETIVWFDYDAALAIHRLRPGSGSQDRTRRLASPVPAEHRASYGCIVVPVRFYESVVAATLGRTAGTVYVLPDSRPLRTFLGELAQRSD